MPSNFDVAVLGGGAAGLFAAIRAAELGTKVILLEKNARPGVKILASGGTRCNLTTTRTGISLERSFRPPQDAFLKPSLRALPPERLRAWFAAHGVPTHTEAMEKVFPDSGKASTVLLALIEAAVSAGVEIRGEADVVRVVPATDGFAVDSSRETVQARRVVLAVGGASYPKSGTTGDGYRIAAALGHEITPRFPALVGLVVPSLARHQLAGVTLPEVGLSLVDGGKAGAGSRRPLVFTHDGCSGPAPMDLSGEIAARGGADLVLDAVPRQAAEELDRSLVERFRESPRKSLLHVLPDDLPERFRRFVLAEAGVEAGRLASTVDRDSRRAVVLALKALRLRAEGTLGYEKAEVTRGGIALAEVEPRTMASLRVPGFHVAGEVLDIDGPLGGFNFQAAFATGFVAGESAARAVLSGARPGARS